MKKIYIIIILVLFVYLLSCGLGPSSGVSDFKIAYIPDDLDHSIYVMNPDGTDKKLVYQENTDSHFHYGNIFWDFDGHIYYITSGSRVEDTLYQLDPNTGSRRVISSSKNITRLIYRPDAYCAFFKSGEQVLHILNFHTKEVQKIYSSELHDLDLLGWSNNPNEILLYKKEISDCNIYTLNLSTITINHLVTIENMSVKPFVSPNSEKIAYLGYDQHTINILNLNSLQSNTIVNSDYLLGGIIWSFDNVHLIYKDVRYQPYTNSLFVFNTNHNTNQKLFTVDDSVYLGYFFPDGSRFSFCVSNIDGRQDILVSSVSSTNYLSLTSNQVTRDGNSDARIPHAISYIIAY